MYSLQRKYQKLIFFFYYFFIDKIIRHRACSLKDVAHALVLTELDAEFEKMCQDIQTARRERGNTNLTILTLF